MPTECEICFEERHYINPCGALNNCKARVCYSCRDRCDPIRGITTFEPLECAFCKSLDYKKNFMLNLEWDVLNFEYYDDEDHLEGYGWNKTSYIAFIMQLKYLLESGLSKNAFEKMPFCVPCDLELTACICDDDDE